MSEIVIIGAGHNGLVCACYLARAGFKVKLLEQRDVVGGACVTEQFHPGFKNSVASYTVSLLQPKIIEELHLIEHGLTILSRPIANFLPLNESQYLQIGPNVTDTQKSIAQFSQRDAEILPVYYKKLEAVADFLSRQVLKAPPNLQGGLQSNWQQLLLATDCWKLDHETKQFAFELFTKSAGDMLDYWFDTDPIKAAFGFDSIVGNFASPYAANSAYVLLHHVFGEVNGVKGAWGHAVGGMGAITQAMAQEAEKLGVDIILNAHVDEIIIDNNQVKAVRLKRDEVIHAQQVVASINPKLLYTKLMDAQHLRPDFLRQIQHYRCGSGTFRINVALKELPEFKCLDKQAQNNLLSGGIIMAPSLQYMEQAYLDAKRLGYAQKPIIEMLIPSLIDPSLAPPGQHVASLFCQHFNPSGIGEENWDKHKAFIEEQIFKTVDLYAPNFSSSIIASMCLSPLDLERKFGLVGGDIFHGALHLDQLFSARPLLGYANYRGPIMGLYMCGAGTHPGGGVTGAPGYNAAQVILQDHKWRHLKNNPLSGQRNCTQASTM